MTAVIISLCVTLLASGIFTLLGLILLSNDKDIGGLFCVSGVFMFFCSLVLGKVVFWIWVIESILGTIQGFQ